MTSVERDSIPRTGWRPGRRLWLLLATSVLLIAATFRLAGLTEVPPGLAQDEVLDADIALFIRGGEHALFFRHGFGHEPLYHYWAALFQPLYGDNVLSIRLPSVYLGLFLVALTIWWARRDYGATAALVTGAGLAVSWWPIIFSRIGIRPILEPVLLVLAMSCWPLRVPDLSRRGLLLAAAAGLFLGLSIYSYTAARAILLIPALMLVLLAGQYILTRRADPARTNAMTTAGAQMIYAAIVLAVGLLVYLPLAVTLRANPGLQQRLEQLEGPLTALRQGEAGPVLAATAATLGVFSVGGDPRWTYSLPDRTLFDPLTALLFYVGLALALWRWRQPVYALLTVWLLVALLPSALSPDAPSTVRLVGALPVVYLMPGLAVDAAGRPSPRRRYLAVILSLGLVAILVVNVTRTVADGFVRWPRELETRLRYQTVLRDIGRYWRAVGGIPVVAEGHYEPIDNDSLRRNSGASPAARWVQTGGGAAGAVVWPAGEEEARLYVPEYAPLDPALLAAAGVDPRPLYRSPEATSFAVYALPNEPEADLQPVEAGFGGGPSVMLLGHGLLDSTEALELVTWWRVEDDLPDDLAIFVHLLDESGAIVAQYDGLDAAAATLRPGDRFLQRHVLPFPPVDSGEHTLVAGLYTRGDGARLAADGGDAVTLWRCDWDEAVYRCRLPDDG